MENALNGLEMVTGAQNTPSSKPTTSSVDQRGRESESVFEKLGNLVQRRVCDHVEQLVFSKRKALKKKKRV